MSKCWGTEALFADLGIWGRGSEKANVLQIGKNPKVMWTSIGDGKGFKANFI